MRSIGARLERLEARQPAHIILEIVVDGHAQRMTAAEFAKTGLDFFRRELWRVILWRMPNCF